MQAEGSGWNSRRKVMRIVGNEVDHFGTLILERDYTRERRIQKALIILGEAVLGIAFFGAILIFFFAVGQ